MPKKKLLYLSDLYNFYSNQNQDALFSSNDDATVVVHIEEPFVFKKDDYDADEYFLKCPIRLCHTEKNRNNSSFSEEAIKEAVQSAYNMPILAYIFENEDGEYDFAGHEYSQDENGETIYYEQPVGVISESADLKLVYDEDKDKTYLDGIGTIWKNYSKAAEILERKGSSKVSIEIAVDDLSYSAKEKTLIINKFHFLGVTILGTDPETGKEIQEGMEGANITLEDFSENRNSITQKLIEELQKFNANFAAFNINQKTEEGGKESVTKFEELLNQYNVTEDDVTFEYDNLSDEELESKFAEAFGSADSSEENQDVSDDPASEDFEDNDEDEASVDENNDEEDGNDDEEAEPENAETYSLKYSINNVDYEISLNDIQYALQTLVNDTYSESDNTYYSVIVYSDTVVMVDYWTGTAYRQSYKSRKGVYTLTGDRVPVHACYLTDEEEQKLDNMKNSYSSISDKLDEYVAKENEQMKNDIVSSSDYSSISDTEEFKEIINNIAEYSIDEVQKKCDDLLLKFVKEGKVVDFSEKKVTTTMTKLPVITEKQKKSRYGNLFSK